MITSNGHILDDSAARLGRLEPVPADERGDKDALWRRLRRDGYLYLSGHLDADVVRDFRRHYFETLAPTGLVAANGIAEGVDAGGAIDLALTRRLLFDDIVRGDE
ncbi:hypothetical protein [Microbacterium sp. 1.5R]|uniref:hypothetical protein n=1 Tax=Microbacterium sp. 1.5R TaxID=1916917 RepID=UPI0021B3C0CD|nr:hypothetical protein [Microbacterium sp. 1.5R]